MKIILAGGSGCIGTMLTTHYLKENHEVIILSRKKPKTTEHVRYVQWDGRTLGPWKDYLEGADMLVNLTGRNVNCRYNKKNRQEILSSRIRSVHVLGKAIRTLQRPIPVWIQLASATIYRHAQDKPMDEARGEIGEGFSVRVCVAWEKAFAKEYLPHTRKVILRTGIVLTNHEGAFPRLKKLATMGLGGRQGNGHQYVSWIHIQDVIRTIQWAGNTPLATGIYNCSAPTPIPNSTFNTRRI